MIERVRVCIRVRVRVYRYCVSTVDKGVQAVDNCVSIVDKVVDNGVQAVDKGVQAVDKVVDKLGVFLLCLINHPGSTVKTLVNTAATTVI